MTITKAEEAVDTLLRLAKENLISGEDLLLSYFGKFKVRDKRERVGRNPQTGDKLLLQGGLSFFIPRDSFGTRLMVNRQFITAWLILVQIVCLFFALPAFCQTITGKVIGVSDGDTITILDSNQQQHKIRLYGIDCPESGQDFGQAAKKHTASLTAQKMAMVEVFDTDRYGRTVGVVTVDRVNVNRELIQAGYAWQYRHYCKESFCRTWLQVENQARIASVGLWSDAQPVPPWEWRSAARNHSSGKSDVSAGLYHGNVKSHVFHRASCRDYNCKNCVETFPGRQAAIAAGYRPCGRCKP